mgnify:CR=1 FL=1
MLSYGGVNKYLIKINNNILTYIIMKKKIKFNNVVQVKYFNKDDIIKKNNVFSNHKIKRLFIFVIFCLVLYKFL